MKLVVTGYFFFKQFQSKINLDINFNKFIFSYLWHLDTIGNDMNQTVECGM